MSDFSSQKAKALFVYLIFESSHTHSRSTLASIFWPDVPEQTALHNLRQALSTIRKTLSESHCDVELLDADRDNLRFNDSVTVQVDVIEFEKQMRLLLESHGGQPEHGFPIHSLIKIIQQNNGQLLPSLAIPDSNFFEDWLILKREGINCLMVEGISLLLRYFERRSEWGTARKYAEKLVSLAPWDEDAHNHLIQILLRLDQGNVALTHFHSTVRYLKKELDIEPGLLLSKAYENIQSFFTKGKIEQSTVFSSIGLPGYATPFIGREKELEILEKWISDVKNKVITITGPGGSGKTRLAAQLAESQVSLFRDGVYFISLVNCLDENEIILQILGSIEGLVEHGKDAFDQLAEWASNRKALIVLDNVESITQTGAFTARLIEQAPQLVLVFTSYTLLDLLGEKVFVLKGLPLNSDNLGNQPSEAVQLFLSHLQPENQPEMSTPGFVEKVAQVCKLVDGIPLAIALAAGQTRSMPVTQLLNELDQNMNLLRTNAVNLPERHRSIQASFENAWAHLSNGQRKSLSLLTGFQSPFTMQAAEEIYGISAVDLSDLNRESLLTWDAGERYRFHRTIRQYAQEKLHMSVEEVKEYSSRYTDWFLKRLISGVAGEELAQFSSFLDSTEHELSDYIQVMRWLIEEKQWEKVKSALTALFRYFEGRGLFREGSDLFSRMAELCSQTPDGLECRVMFCSRAAVLLIRVQQFEKAASLSEFAYEESLRNGWKAELAFCLNIFSSRALAEKSSSQGEQKALQALEIARESKISEEESHALYNLGFARINKGDLEPAAENLTLCRQLCTQQRNWFRLAKTLNSLADIACYRGELTLALEYFTQSLSIVRGIGNRYSEALVNNNIGTVYIEMKELDSAKDYLDRSLILCREIFDHEGEAVALANLGEVALNEDQLQVSIENCLLSLKISREIESNWERCLPSSSWPKHTAELETWQRPLVRFLRFLIYQLRPKL